MFFLEFCFNCCLNVNNSNMWLIYMLLLSVLLCLSNVYLVWLLMEINFLFFFLILLSKNNKNVGLIIYYFFQSFVSLILFISIYFSMSKMIFLLISAKLGLFPFFYWILVVSVKVTLEANFFVLGLQKISVFWMLWLMIDVYLNLLYMYMYMSIFFAIMSLLSVSDLWLLLVYSSIANTGMLMVGVYGSSYFFIVVLYLVIVMIIISFLSGAGSGNEIMFVVFFFLIIPPFMLFFMKFYVIVSMEFYLKLGFFLSFLDVFVLLYYFSLVFMKFMIFENVALIYYLNLLLLFCILMFSNYVTMIVFY